MDIKNLYFFDYNGYNLNFEWDALNEYWEGTIYFPKVSVGLYANTTIYILEKIGDGSDSDEGYFVFPQQDKTNKKFVFEWDSLNKFVDEFFMFNFDDSYTVTDTSALTYTPNDGPEGETLIVNRFDTYEVNLDTTESNTVLPVHIAFMANEKYDATTYARTLIISCGETTIARIKFIAETIEEDERLQIWNSNLGYNITLDDTLIFKTSDIKEYKPDYKLLNEKRKELMLEGSNIYPYIGSYRAIINAIKFFGYNNLNILEYWRNVNSSDPNFGKIYHSSKYSLTKKETLRVDGKKIDLPSKNYKKINQLALVYTINHPTGEVDDWELPLVKEDFTYTIEEALIKLFALRTKLNKEFMPATSRIIDIIGEGNYFGLIGIHKSGMMMRIDNTTPTIKPKFETNTGKYVYLTDDRFFDKYIIEKQGYTSVPLTGGKLAQFNVIGDVSTTTIYDLNNTVKQIDQSTNAYPTPEELCQLYTDYYNEVFVEHTRIEDDVDTDDENAPSSAKLVLSNTTFDNTTFGGSNISFGYQPSEVTLIEQDDKKEYKLTQKDTNLTFDNISTYGHSTTEWVINMSGDQTDDELKSIGVEKKYERKEFNETYTGDNIFVKLPYIGYYDVIMTVDGVERRFNRSIKVEPYHIDIKGFYYDARELPKKITTNTDDEFNAFILERIQNMTAWAVTERTSQNNDIDFSMPTYSADGSMINSGPYTEDEKEEWGVLDNVNDDISKLYPIVKYARYIKNGVDVKPYTWFLLGYEYSKIVGKCTPVWTITNNTTNEYKTYEGRYLTFLLKKTGNYTVELTLKDRRGNEYKITRNIFVVSGGANYKIYQSIKNDYDFLVEQKQLAETRNLQDFS